MFNEVIILIILFLVLLLPGIKLISICYYSFILFIVLLLIIILICSLRINSKLKILILIVLISCTKDLILIVSKTLGYISYYKFLKKQVPNKEETINNVKELFEPNIKLDLNFKKLPDKPSIFICNYCNDRLENLACILIPKKMAVIMKSKIFSKFVDYTIFTKDSGSSYDKIKKEIGEHVGNGVSVLSYVTNAPKGRRDVRKMRSGMFRMANELNIPITLVTIDYLDIDFTVKKQKLYMEIGDTFYVDDINEAMAKTKLYFRKTLRKFRKNKDRFYTS
jgi:hypothetical protein